ncbi:MAG: hypothetical protein F6K16_37700 [Symploca sp. SIO2B6]|nr:hypothetical protein [Symploca sp. SIO2B6]
MKLLDSYGEELKILIVYHQPITPNNSKPQKRQWSSTFLQTFGAWRGTPSD